MIVSHHNLKLSILPFNKLELVTTVQDFFKFLKDDAALLRAADARWLVVPVDTKSLWHSQKVDGDSPDPESEADKENEGSFHLNKSTHLHGLRIALPEEATEICPREGLSIGRGVDCGISVDHPKVLLLFNTSHPVIAVTLFLYHCSRCKDRLSASCLCINFV